MGSIDIQKTKDEVAKGHNYETWGKALNGHRYNFISSEEMNQMTDEVILEVAKQVEEAKNKICYDIVTDGTPKELLDGTLQLKINLSKSPEIK